VQRESALTPIQQWFFELPLENRAHWNQSLLLEPRQALDAELLRQALLQLVKHHDALRLTFRQEGGRWHAEHRAADDGAWLLWQAQVASFDDCAEVFERAQRSLALDGPLLRALLATTADGTQRLLLVIHHLVVDGVSWRILLEDLESAYRQLAAGQPPRLPARTSSLQAWALCLAEHAGSGALAQELDYWRNELQGADPTLPCDNPEGSRRKSKAQHIPAPAWTATGPAACCKRRRRPTAPRSTTCC